MFNFGVGDLTIIVVVAMVFIGSKHLVQVGRESRDRSPGHRERPPWKASEWLLVAVTVVVGLLATALVLAGR
jgi:hypothetical protein